MIFVTVGSQKFQFNRLLKEVDKLVEEKKITEEVFAQIGYSDYKPKNYQYKNFIDREEFTYIMERCDKIITHGGTGAIIGAVKKGKKVIAAPRLARYGEHVDDHQLQIVDEFSKLNYIVAIKDIKDLLYRLNSINSKKFKHYESNTKTILKSIDEFIKCI